MPKDNRVFIAFAKEDILYRDFLIGQADNKRTPFSFVDMSVKKPWDSQWKTNCRTKIRGCDGMIALVSQNTLSADGQLWEVKCATDEEVPVIGMYIHTDNRPWFLPDEFAGIQIVGWTWDNIESFLDSL